MARPKKDILNALKHELPRDSRLLIGVSGGMDSVCLLHACMTLQSELRLQVEVCHINHRIRTESGRDAEFVRELASQYGIPFHLKECGPPEEGCNLEHWGRQQRYSFFRDTLQTRALDLALTAHTANDVAETFLMKLLSNKELKPIMRLDPRRRLLRPLLLVSRTAVEEYVKTNALKFVTDTTNFDRTFFRNRIRHDLIPQLAREYDARIVETLAYRAHSVAEDLESLYAISAEAEERLGQVEFGSKEWVKRTRTELGELPEACGWRLMESILSKKIGFSPSRSKCNEVVKLITEGCAGVELPGDYAIRPSGGGILIVKGTQKNFRNEGNDQ